MFRFVFFIILILLPTIGFACGGGYKSSPESLALDITLVMLITIAGSILSLWLCSKVYKKLHLVPAFIIYPILLIAIASSISYFVLDYKFDHFLLSIFLSTIVMGAFIFSYMFILLKASTLKKHNIGFSIYVAVCISLINLSISVNNIQEMVLLVITGTYFISLMHSLLVVVMQRDHMTND